MASEQRKRRVLAAPRFLKSKRTFKEEDQLAIDDQVKEIVDNPPKGEPKVGVLKGVRVVKFKIGPQQYLLAYLFNSKTNTIEFLDVAVHENFYRNLQDYLTARPK